MRLTTDKIIFLIACLISIFWQLEGGISQELDKKNNWKPTEGLELIGTKAPSFEGLNWLNTEPINIEDLKGKVVLIRFWLVGCPLCEHTAPALVELYYKYKDDGFIVVGIHHPKSEDTKNPDLVRRAMNVFSFDFPVAQDNDWKVINSYWLGGKKRSFTSSSILIDKNGIIRFVHDGGEFYRSGSNPDADRAYQAIEEKIQELLGE
ncbi:MAG TPA: redoxin domain-containing protein [Thermodesulfobacteriota bacterium]|nr:redoxin domain-containing protein [Thermodesulfobacteriota bacterium]